MGMMPGEIELVDAEERLACELRRYNSLAVAVSGGTDSLFLATFAIEILGRENVLPIHAVLPFSPKRETRLVREWAKERNIDVKILELDLLKEESVTRNDSQRCYYCKRIIMQNFIAEVRKINDASEIVFAEIADGTVLDDFGDYRPGLKATEELGIIHPLADAGFSKRILRNIARKNGLKNWNMPASACLASRIPCGIPLNAEILQMVGDAEEFLTDYGFPGCRVRVPFDREAKIEVRPIYFRKLMKIREFIIKKFKRIGFNSVSMDPAGYRRGAMNSAGRNCD